MCAVTIDKTRSRYKIHIFFRIYDRGIYVNNLNFDIKPRPH